MSYTKTVWKDQNVQKPRTYTMRDNGDDTITLLDAFGTITEIGTPVNASNMNHIENGIKDLDTNKANDTAVVHIAGAENITGQKTFTGTTKQKNNHLIYNESITKGTNPSATQYINNYMAGDSMSVGDTSALGLFRTYVTSTGVVNSAMEAFKNTSGSSAHFDIRAVYDTANNRYWAQMSSGNSGTDTNYSLSYATSATDNLYIPTMGWVNNPATSTNVVHRSGDETIAGTKTFSSQAIFEKANGIQLKGTNHYYTLRSVGTTPEGCALLLDNSTSSIAFNATDNRITIGSSAIPAYAVAPTATTSDSSEQIATCGWVNTVGNSVVHLNGTETITGSKTFTVNPVVNNADPRVFLKNTDITKGTAPAADEVNAFQIRDKNNNILGSFQTQYQTNKRVVTQMVAYKAQSASDTDSVRMGIGYDIDGNESTWAPACDHDQSIVTTISKSKAANGYFKLGNGLIVQWGTATCNSGNNNISFPTAFSNTNYRIVSNLISSTNNSGAGAANSIYNKSTTGCIIQVRAYPGVGIGAASSEWLAIGY